MTLLATALAGAFVVEAARNDRHLSPAPVNDVVCNDPAGPGTEVHKFECADGVKYDFEAVGTRWNACHKKGSYVKKCPSMLPIVCAIQSGGATACAQIVEDCPGQKERPPGDGTDVKYFFKITFTGKCAGTIVKLKELVLTPGGVPCTNEVQKVDNYRCEGDAPGKTYDMNKATGSMNAWTEGCKGKSIESCPNDMEWACEDQSPGNLKCSQNPLLCTGGAKNCASKVHQNWAKIYHGDQEDMSVSVEKGDEGDVTSDVTIDPIPACTTTPPTPTPTKPNGYKETNPVLGNVNVDYYKTIKYEEKITSSSSNTLFAGYSNVRCVYFMAVPKTMGQPPKNLETPLEDYHKQAYHSICELDEAEFEKAKTNQPFKFANVTYTEKRDNEGVLLATLAGVILEPYLGPNREKQNGAFFHVTKYTSEADDSKCLDRDSEAARMKAFYDCMNRWTGKTGLSPDLQRFKEMWKDDNLFKNVKLAQSGTTRRRLGFPPITADQDLPVLSASVGVVESPPLVMPPVYVVIPVAAAPMGLLPFWIALGVLAGLSALALVGFAAAKKKKPVVFEEDIDQRIAGNSYGGNGDDDMALDDGGNGHGLE